MLASTLYYKNFEGLSPAATQAIKTLIYLAWLIKPLLGFVADSFPIAGYKRKPYILISGVIGTVCYLSILAVSDMWTASLCLVLNEMVGALCDVIADAIMV